MKTTIIVALMAATCATLLLAQARHASAEAKIERRLQASQPK